MAPQGPTVEMPCVLGKRNWHPVWSGRKPNFTVSEPVDCGELSWEFSDIRATEQVQMCLPWREDGWEGEGGEAGSTPVPALVQSKLINLLFSFPGLGVKCSNIYIRAGSEEWGPQLCQGIPPTYFFLSHKFFSILFSPRGIFSQVLERRREIELKPRK